MKKYLYKIMMECIKEKQLFTPICLQGFDSLVSILENSAEEAILSYKEIKKGKQSKIYEINLKNGISIILKLNYPFTKDTTAASLLPYKESQQAMCDILRGNDVNICETLFCGEYILDGVLSPRVHIMYKKGIPIKNPPSFYHVHGFNDDYNLSAIETIAKMHLIGENCCGTVGKLFSIRNIQDINKDLEVVTRFQSNENHDAYVCSYTCAYKKLLEFFMNELKDKAFYEKYNGNLKEFFWGKYRIRSFRQLLCSWESGNISKHTFSKLKIIYIFEQYNCFLIEYKQRITTLVDYANNLLIKYYDDLIDLPVSITHNDLIPLNFRKTYLDEVYLVDLSEMDYGCIAQDLTRQFKAVPCHSHNTYAFSLSERALYDILYIYTLYYGLTTNEAKYLLLVHPAKLLSFFLSQVAYTIDIIHKIANGSIHEVFNSFINNNFLYDKYVSCGSYGLYNQDAAMNGICLKWNFLEWFQYLESLITIWKSTDILGMIREIVKERSNGLPNEQMQQYLFNSWKWHLQYKDLRKELYLLYSKSRVLSGEIFLVTGSSSSGKSSIVNKISNIVGHFIRIEKDVIWNEVVGGFLMRNYKKDYLRVIKYFGHNTLNYIRFLKDNIPFVNYTNSELRGILENLHDAYCKNEYGIMKEIKNLIISRLNFFVRNNGRIISDSVYDEEYIHQMPVQPKITLVYCDLRTLFNHINQRNDDAVNSRNVENWRPPLRVLQQFVTMYKATSMCKKFFYADKINKKLLINILDRIICSYGYKANKIFISGNTETTRNKFLLKIFDDLGLTGNTETSLIEFKYKYDLKINSGKLAPSEAAALLKNTFFCHSRGEAEIMMKPDDKGSHFPVC